MSAYRYDRAEQHDNDRKTDVIIPGTVTSTSVTEHIFRTGLNYHFNSPVVAKY